MTSSPHAILVVDDDPDIREALVDVLSDHGYATTAVANGREALSKLRSGSLPSVILLDLMMPVMDGSEFRQEQLKDPRLKAVPVIVISAGNELPKQTSALAVTDTMRKPIELELLLAAIARHTGESASPT